VEQHHKEEGIMSEYESRSRVTAVTGVTADAALSQATSAASVVLGAAAAVAAAALVGTVRAAIAAHAQMKAKAGQVSASHCMQQSPIGAITSSSTIGACTAVPMANKPVTVHAVNPEGILSATRIPPVISPEYRRQMQAMPVDKAKLSALAEIATSNLFIRDAHTVQQGVSAILQARTMDEVQAQSVICERAIRQEHQGLLQEACAAVYEASMAQIGFTQVERLVAGSGVIRTIGMDVRGRTLVNEISLHDGEVAAESEVLGVGDNTCSAVLDELGRALERNGLRSGDASRRPTGGICQSQAALDYIGKGVSPVHRRSGKSLAKVGLQ
jgi:hypothetical protein